MRRPATLAIALSVDITASQPIDHDRILEFSPSGIIGNSITTITTATGGVYYDHPNPMTKWILNANAEIVQDEETKNLPESGWMRLVRATTNRTC